VQYSNLATTDQNIKPSLKREKREQLQQTATKSPKSLVPEEVDTSNEDNNAYFYDIQRTKPEEEE
jgi:hypothetical protein